jgi:hypothetical protein
MSVVTNHSQIRKLRKENKSDPDLELKLSRLTLEELISLKLELIYKSVGDKTSLEKY